MNIFLSANLFFIFPNEIFTKNNFSSNSHRLFRTLFSSNTQSFREKLFHVSQFLFDQICNHYQKKKHFHQFKKKIQNYFKCDALNFKQIIYIKSEFLFLKIIFIKFAFIFPIFIFTKFALIVSQIIFQRKYETPTFSSFSAEIITSCYSMNIVLQSSHNGCHLLSLKQFLVSTAKNDQAVRECFLTILAIHNSYKIY